MKYNLTFLVRKKEAINEFIFFSLHPKFSSQLMPFKIAGAVLCKPRNAKYIYRKRERKASVNVLIIDFFYTKRERQNNSMQLKLKTRENSTLEIETLTILCEKRCSFNLLLSLYLKKHK